MLITPTRAATVYIVMSTGYDDVHSSDLSDYDSVVKVTRGMDAIVHLGGDPGGGTPLHPGGNWESILNSNIIGARNIFEAARENGVKRIAYASRAGVLGDYPQDDPNTFRHTMLPTTPRGDYTISKVFGPSGALNQWRITGYEPFCSKYVGDVVQERRWDTHTRIRTIWRWSACVSAISMAIQSE
jgi:nucleoside-diphosphate-sugar epimerase